MFELTDGRDYAYQWDTGLYVDCTGLAESDEVHFCRPGITLALHPAMQGETLTARVPDELLQQAQPIIVFAYVQTATGEITKVSTRLCVTARPKPPGYISTITHALRWENLQKQIGDLTDLHTQDKTNLVAAVNEAMTKGGGADPASVQQIVEDYLTENPPAAGADGADGLTPTIGANGNWYLGDTDTGKPSRGEKGETGPAGTPGKSAYQYAVEGGYTGTEAEFSEKLAQEQLVGTTNDLTPTQVYEAVSAGIPVKVQYTDRTYGLLSFTAFSASESLNVIASSIIVYYNGVYILAELFGDKSWNTWGFMTTTLAQKTDIPDTLPNPNALTFTGAVTGSYDGSAPLTVNIPSGGSGGSDAWNLIDHFTVADAAISYAIHLQPGAKEYGIYWNYTQSIGSIPKRSIMVDSSLALYGVMYRCTNNETLFLRVFKGPSNILATGQGVGYAAQRFSNGGTNIGSGTDFPAMTLTTDITCTTSEIWVYWR